MSKWRGSREIEKNMLKLQTDADPKKGSKTVMCGRPHTFFYTHFSPSTHFLRIIEIKDPEIVVATKKSLRSALKFLNFARVKFSE